MKKNTLVLMTFLAMIFIWSCAKDSNDNVTPQDTPRQATIRGTWSSSGSDVAPLLKGAPLNIDSIYAKFEGTTYLVESFDTAGTKITYNGSYTTITSDTTSIVRITLNQSAPQVIESQGIFRVWLASPDSMFYEVVQTNPSIVGVTPPTVAGGFGSTSGGAFGTINIQKFRRLGN